MTRIRKWLPQLALVAASVMAISATAGAAEKPNILVIFGDDIGQTNLKKEKISSFEEKSKAARPWV